MEIFTSTEVIVNYSMCGLFIQNGWQAMCLIFLMDALDKLSINELFPYLKRGTI